MSTEAPAKPDPNTGEPRPPAAPLVLGKIGPEQTKSLDGIEPPPDGRGPAQENYHHDKRAVFFGAGIIVALIVVAVSIGQGGFSWMADPIPRVMIGAAVVFTLGRDWNSRTVAGTDWLRINRRWVDTYDIRKIYLYGVIVGWTLVLEDSEQRKVRVYIGTLEANRELWALVYNGLAHSVSAGATFNPLAGNMLRLRQFKRSD